MSKSSKRGRLKIYLGMSAGVGKTYAMLKDAHEDLKQGIDVVAGYIEPHGREETESLASAFEAIPTKEIIYESIKLKEFDLEKALKRSPHTILVDELAHTNAPGSLHNKRWLDIQTLLDAGINVYSTLNIQHLESISELVGNLCDITIHETVPDSILQEADSIEVIDIPPEELIDRLKAGKIYKDDKIDAALRNFFKEGSLLALREMLLRKAAEKIDKDVLKYRNLRVVKDSWASSDRMIVAIGPNRFAKRLIKKASLIASSRKSSLTVVFVQTPHRGSLNAKDQNLVDEALQVAHRNGATIDRRSGSDIVTEILKSAVEHNASLILVGKPIKNRFKDLLFRSLADELVRRSGNIDVLLVTGEADDASNRSMIIRDKRPRFASLLYSLLTIGVCTLIGRLIDPHVEITTIAMLYILGAVIIAWVSGRFESIVASVAAILAFNFFFIEPKFTFYVYNTEYLVTFLAMLVVSSSISGLVTQIRLQNEIVNKREKRATTLYETSRQIGESDSIKSALKVAQQSILSVGDFECGIFISIDNVLHLEIPSKSHFEIEPGEFAVAKYVMEKRKEAGFSTDVLPGAMGLYLPIKTERALYGVCAVTHNDSSSNIKDLDQDIIQTIELILHHAAMKMERNALEKEANDALVKIEAEEMRSLILRSISHDFRTPLTVIEGAAEQLASNKIASSAVPELAQLILEHSQRLSRVVNNALSYASLEGSVPKLNTEWESLEELVGQALDKYRDRLSNRKVKISFSESLPLLKIDAVLIDQLITNVIENSIRHAKEATFLEIIGGANDTTVTLQFIDDGPGINSNEKLNLPKSDTHVHDGSGLGISLCTLIAKLHGGTFSINKGDQGGTIVTLTLPLTRSI